MSVNKKVLSLGDSLKKTLVRLDKVADEFKEDTPDCIWDVCLALAEVSVKYKDLCDYIEMQAIFEQSSINDVERFLDNLED